MDLKLIKTRYGGKCARCGRELKADWEVYFNPESNGKAKDIYCKPCGTAIINDQSQILPQQQHFAEEENLQELARLQDVSLKIDHINTFCNVLASDISRLNNNMKSIEEQIKTLIDKLSDFLANESVKETSSKAQSKTKKK